MRKTILIILCSMLVVSLFAEFTPYGSARVNYFLNKYDKNHENSGDIGKSRTVADYVLSASSSFGVDYELDSITANVEFAVKNDDNGENIGIDIFTLWAKYQFDGFSLLAGLAEDGTCHTAEQLWGEELGLIGYGATYGDANPQIRWEMDNGLYFALIMPYTDDDPVSVNLSDIPTTTEEELEIITDSIEYIIPKINLGMDISISDDFKIMPSVVFQRYTYNKEFSGLSKDVTVTSWLGALTLEYAIEPASIVVQFNCGQNTGNMGYEGSGNVALWEVPNESGVNVEKLINTTTFGGFLALGYDLSEAFNLNTGVGIASSMNKQWDNDDAHMAAYLQGIWKFDDFSILPEVGMIMEMNEPYQNDDHENIPRGSNMYGGLQLRYEF